MQYKFVNVILCQPVPCKNCYVLPLYQHFKRAQCSQCWTWWLEWRSSLAISLQGVSGVWGEKKSRSILKTIKEEEKKSSLLTFTKWGSKESPLLQPWNQREDQSLIKTEYLRCNFSVKKVYEEMDSFIGYNFPKLMNKYCISPFPNYADMESTTVTSLLHKD